MCRAHVMVDYPDTLNELKLLHLNTIIEIFIYFPFYNFPNNIYNKKRKIYKVLKANLKTKIYIYKIILFEKSVSYVSCSR